jgi:HisJ family histidinol phosphate phosphatase
MNSVDHHSYIIHAGTVEMIEAAKRNKIDDYSITEHVSQFRELRESVRFGSVHTNVRTFESWREYSREFEKTDEDLGFGIRIRRGLEVDYSPRYETRVGDFVNQEEWEILLCSVHE